MGVEAFITKHFGGVPRTFKDLARIILIERIFCFDPFLVETRSNDPPIVPPACEYRTVSPGCQPTFARPKEDKINANYYYTHDVRRAYPAIAVHTNEDIQMLVGTSQARLTSGSAAPAEAGVPSALPLPHQAQNTATRARCTTWVLLK
ncbi:hypothetical protein BC830DRAFT_1080549 [Chytriomyces sp. MP71]|nr:hypothetical protein BC830DRAFT_1080549 [Chytriomyces sp. MP71]